MSPSIARPRALPRHGLILLLSVLAGGACGDDPTAPEPTPVGTYELVQINGEGLPWIFIEFGADKIEITAGTLELDADRTCRAEIEFRFTELHEVSTSSNDATCTWTRDGSDLTFTYPEGDTDSAHWTGDQIDLRGEFGSSMTFRRISGG